MNNRLRPGDRGQHDVVGDYAERDQTISASTGKATLGLQLVNSGIYILKVINNHGQVIHQQKVAVK